MTHFQIPSKGARADSLAWISPHKNNSSIANVPFVIAPTTRCFKLISSNVKITIKLKRMSRKGLVSW